MKNKKTAALLLASLIAAGTFAGCNTPDTNTSVPESSSEVSTNADSSTDSQSETSDTETTSTTNSSSSEATETISNGSQNVDTSKKPTSSSSENSSKSTANNSSSSASSNSNRGNTSTNPSSNSSSTQKSSSGGSTSNSSSGNSSTSSKPSGGGSSSSKPAHVHSWSSWKTTKKATTTSTGLKERTCSGCGKKETKSIAKLSSGSGSGSSSGGSSSGSGSSSSGVLKQQKAVYSYKGLDPYCSVTLVDLLNEERAKRGLCKLEWTPNVYQELYDSGEVDEEDWGSEWFVNGKFDPYNCPGVKSVLNAAQVCADRQQAGHGGVQASCVGAVYGRNSIEQALRDSIKGYLNSPGHYDLLMSPGSHSVTAAYAIGSDGGVYTAITCGG